METWNFRGWDATGQKGWVYSDLVHNKKVTKTGLEDRVMVGGYEVAPESVGICLNAEDNYGHTLYEGDICLITMYGQSMIAYIFFNETMCQFMLSAKHWAGPLYFTQTCEKKGTMYENNDLLKRYD